MADFEAPPFFNGVVEGVGEPSRVSSLSPSLFLVICSYIFYSKKVRLRFALSKFQSDLFSFLFDFDNS